MCDWFLLLDLQVQQARANARALGFPASTWARLRAREFAVALGQVVPSPAQSQAAIGPPDVKTTKTYEELDRERRLCDHRFPNKTSACKKYGAASQTRTICNLCGRRWIQRGDHWEVYDREQAEKSRPSSSRSAPTSSVPTTTRTASRAPIRINRPRSRASSSPSASLPAASVTSEPSWDPPTEEISDMDDSPSEFEFL